MNWLALMAVLSLSINVGLLAWIYYRERQVRRQVEQLDPLLADIAAAIRERGPDLHLRLPDVK